MSEITSAREAIEVAEKFIEPYYPWRQPVKAVREGDTWLVEFDVGAVKVVVASVKLDAHTREIKEFNRAPVLS
ncbi:MAG: hypothetical protein L0177_10055 [Chloroflexi bacterium]|nr:hypothetical protein [Chloroflexota bacterium]